MKTNYHTHTTRCMHATGSDEDYVLSAIKGGYQELGFSDHTPWKYHTDYVADMRMLPEELPGYVESLRSLREKYRDQISIKIGLECEYFPAYIHWLKEKIKEYQLDYILFGNVPEVRAGISLQIVCLIISYITDIIFQRNMEACGCAADMAAG